MRQTVMNYFSKDISDFDFIKFKFKLYFYLPCFFPFVLRPTFLTLHRDVSAASNFTDFLATFAHGMHLGLLPCLRGTHNANFFLHLVHSPSSLQAAQFSAQSETRPTNNLFAYWKIAMHKMDFNLKNHLVSRGYRWKGKQGLNENKIK